MSSSAALRSILGDYDGFLFNAYNDMHKLGFSLEELNQFQIDHLCYRCQTFQEYEHIKTQLLALSSTVILAEENMIGGRPIAVYELKEELMSTSCNWKTNCLELTSPKEGITYDSGFEHIEIPIGSTEKEMIDSFALLDTFAKKHPSMEFDYVAIQKPINSDIKLTLTPKSCVKFHALPLLQVVRYEQTSGDSTPVPADFIAQKIAQEKQVQV